MDTPSPAPEGRPSWFARLLRRGNIPAPAAAAAAPGGSVRRSSFWPSQAQLRYLPATLSAREQWIVRVAILLALASAVMLLVRFYQRHSAYLPRPGGSYIEGIVGAPKFINPILAQSNDADADLAHLLFRGLYRVNASGALEHALAESEMVSDDGTTYTIVMRQGTKWHDGQTVSASDVAFTFDRIQDAESQSPLMKIFKDVRIEVVDDRTVKFILQRPYAPFLSLLTVGLLPEHIWGDVPATNTTLAEWNQKPVGNGPFRFDQLTKDRQGTIKSYRLVRFDEFYGDAPYLESLTFRFYKTRDEAVAALQRNAVQGLSFVTTDARDQVLKKSVVLRGLRLPQYAAVFMNQKKAPLLKEKALRMALEQAVDKSAIVGQALDGAGTVISTPILPGYLGYNPDMPGQPFNTDEARKAFDAAGWTLPEGATVRKKGDAELRFTLTTVDRPEYTKTAELLKSQWAAVGVAVEVKTVASIDILKKTIKPRDYDALLFGEIIGQDPDPYPFWHSSQSYDNGLNLAGFANKDADVLLEDARKSHDPEARKQKYLQFQTILDQEKPAIFLYSPHYLYALPKKLRGFTLERVAVPADRFNGVEQWYMKTRRVWK